ncbi:ZPLD1 protein, partial [Polypterus senegalus]
METDLTSSDPPDVTSGPDPMSDEHKPDPYDLTSYYSDIAVTCGAYSIDLAIQVCPVVYAGYNETLLLLNNLISDPNCKGKLDMTANPPALRFSFSLNETGICGSSYKDVNYTTFLQIPPRGVNLKTPIYVQVKATNLTSKFNVLLDRCYASVSQYPSNSSSFDLFVSCNKQELVNIYVNGKSQYARFSFSAFRFTEHRNATTSTYYLHCITRLCDTNECANLQKVISKAI